MSVEKLRSRYLKVLLDQFEETQYPSAPMMDRIEAAISDRETAEAYVKMLIDRVEQSRYPSPPMVDRVRGLLSAL